MTLRSNFEILAENLFPPGLVDEPNNPFAIQGYWVQISVNPTAQAQTISINFRETTNFTKPTSQSYQVLNAEYIDGGGVVNVYSSFFPVVPPAFPNTGGLPGFNSITIAPGETFIFGVQALPPPVKPEASQGDATPPVQGGIGWRGTVEISGQALNSLSIAPTQRLVYFQNSSLSSVLSASVYPAPLFL